MLTESLTNVIGVPKSLVIAYLTTLPYEYRYEAIDNFLTCYLRGDRPNGSKPRHLYANDIVFILAKSFVWSSTDQGHETWKMVYQRTSVWSDYDDRANLFYSAKYIMICDNRKDLLHHLDADEPIDKPIDDKTINPLSKKRRVIG